MAIIDGYDGLVLDLDGVVFRGTELVRGAAGWLRRRRNRPPMVFVTNNSSRTPEEWVEMFTSARIDVEPDRVLTSATATAELLVRGGASNVFALGEYGLRTALRRAGIKVVEDAAVAETVVVGFDRTLAWDRLRDAASAIERGARFVATNPDPRVPTADGTVPGTGATVAFLRAATGAAPEVVGKPMTGMLEQAGRVLDVAGPVLLVGDQLGTDVAGARAMGWDAALVRSGVDDLPELVAAPVLPTYVLSDLGAIDDAAPPTVRTAREGDISAIRTLLEQTGFDTERVAARLATTLVAETGEGRVVGTAAWELVGSAAHLRAITVDAAERGLGTATTLVATALHQLRGTNVEWAYLLTPGADGLFEQLGFWRVHRDRVPTEILDTAQYGGPADGGTALVRRLRP